VLIVWVGLRASIFELGGDLKGALGTSGSKAPIHLRVGLSALDF
jgi:hypothetical protein